MILADIGLSQAALYAVLGYAVVFFGLVLLMTLMVILGKFFIATAKRKAVAPAIAAPVVPDPLPAPGSAGDLKLYNVDPKTAAMLMAIVANKLQKPINELRFISIKEVEQ